MYDLILRNGRLYDTQYGFGGANADIAIENGIISKIAANIPESSSHEIDLGGHIVTPGLVDFHAHFYYGGTGTSLSFGSYLPTGVTNAVDAGSSGSSNMEAFLSGQSELERRNTRAYLYLSSEGQASLPAHDENIDPQYFERKKIRLLCQRYPERILGLKLRISETIAKKSGVSGFDSLRAGIDIAEECGLPLSVHIPDFIGELGELIDILRPGDVFCHVFTPRRGIIQDGVLSAEMFRGKEKGIVMETACGKGQLGHRVALEAFRKGFYPDIISGDFTGSTFTFSPAGTLPFLMSRFMALGMTFEQVLACCTAAPARKMGLCERIGCLKQGAIANVAVFALHQGEFLFDDVEHNVVCGKSMLIPQMTVLEGRVVFNQLIYGGIGSKI